MRDATVQDFPQLNSRRQNQAGVTTYTPPSSRDLKLPYQPRGTLQGQSEKLGCEPAHQRLTEPSGHPRTRAIPDRKQDQSARRGLDSRSSGFSVVCPRRVRTWLSRRRCRPRLTRSRRPRRSVEATGSRERPVPSKGIGMAIVQKKAEEGTRGRAAVSHGDGAERVRRTRTPRGSASRTGAEHGWRSSPRAGLPKVGPWRSRTRWTSGS